MAKTIDLTPTWSQWLNLVMGIALRSADAAKALEPLSEDFKKLARAADGWNAIPNDTIDLIDEAIKLISYLSAGQTSTDEPGEPNPELLEKLKGLRSSLLKAVDVVQG